jgi:hypothetical protein
MSFILKFITPKIKNGIIYSFTSGFFIGCIPNNVSINYENKKYTNISTPLVTGLITSIGFILSPLLIINYFNNGVYFDKLIDKYNISIERYHQYDGQENKYAYPSLLIVNIKTKL